MKSKDILNGRVDRGWLIDLIFYKIVFIGWYVGSMVELGL